jgi:hypothetical protein
MAFRAALLDAAAACIARGAQATDLLHRAPPPPLSVLPAST